MSDTRQTLIDQTIDREIDAYRADTNVPTSAIRQRIVSALHEMECRIVCDRRSGRTTRQLERIIAAAAAGHICFFYGGNQMHADGHLRHCAAILEKAGTPFVYMPPRREIRVGSGAIKFYGLHCHRGRIEYPSLDRDENEDDRLFRLPAGCDYTLEFDHAAFPNDYVRHRS